MRWLVLGGHGMLGRDLLPRLRALPGAEVVAPARADLDLTDPAALAAAATGVDIVVNCAAFTNVDGAESQRDEAFAVNATGAGDAAAAAAVAGAGFVQVSTDYVFDGTANSPYPEDAPVAPLSVYGASKAEGERLVRAAHPDAWIVRTAWLYGDGTSFPRTMLRLARDRDTVAVVTDQTGQPTWTADVADAILRLVAAQAPAGTYHATNSGAVSRFEFARAIFEVAGLDPARVVPTDGASFGHVARRPAYSVLGHAAWERAGLAPPRDWLSALRESAGHGALEIA